MSMKCHNSYPTASIMPARIRWPQMVAVMNPVWPPLKSTLLIEFLKLYSTSRFPARDGAHSRISDSGYLGVSPEHLHEDDSTVVG